MDEKSKTFVFTLEDNDTPTLDENDTSPKTFSFSNFADQFDGHIEKSIRGYTDLRNDVVGMSKFFIEEGTQVLDIGCSEGTLLERIAGDCPVGDVEFIGCEIENSFVAQWEKRDLPKELHLLNEDILDWGNDDKPLSKILKPNNLSLVVSLFTMQFLAERHRLELFKKIYDNLVDGGAFITSEKIFAQNAKVQNMLEFLYYDYKKQHFSEKEILDKEEQLRFLAKLTTENLLMKQLRSVGFRGIQIFWRNFNFIGVLAMKRPKEEMDDC